jgi:hypothetical protein
MSKKINLEISFKCCILKSIGAWFNELSTCNAFLNHIKKICFGCQMWVYGKFTFEGASHCHSPKIQIPKNVYQGA